MQSVADADDTTGLRTGGRATLRTPLTSEGSTT